MTLDQIHSEIDALSEQRSDLWRSLSQGYDPGVADGLKRLDERLAELWAAHRQLRATLRFGTRDKIVARARAEERLERQAA